MLPIKHSNGVLEMPMDPTLEPDTKGAAWRYFYKMKEFSDRIAQIEADTSKYDTYEDIVTRCIRVALHMKKMGITIDDNISLCTGTHRQTCLPFWATIFLGAKLANLDPSISLSEITHLINITKPKLIFCDPDCVENLNTVIKDLNLNCKLVVFGETEKHIPFKNLLVSQEGETEFIPNPVNNLFDTVAILYSSGTTGLPKGVCITHYGLLHAVNIFKETFDMTSCLYFSSSYWISYILFICTILETGGQKVICQFDEKKIFNIIEDYKVTFLFLPPSFTFAITSFAESNNEVKQMGTSFLKRMTIGGGCIGKEQLKKMRNIFNHSTIYQLYGLTECTGPFSLFRKNYDDELVLIKETSSGKMIPNVMCKIIDIETNEILGPNQPGELLLKTKKLMSGYYKDPTRTAELFDEDGFLHTGDIVYYDEDFCFYVVDRIKEMFKYKSWHVVPAELENILLRHSAVKEAVVIGYPHEEDGDHPMAVIVLKEGAVTTENDILQYFNSQVSDRKKLRAGIKFVKNIPRTPTGKFSRRITRIKIINNEI